METPDNRGAGGRAPRGLRGVTPANFMVRVATPLMRLVTKGRTGTSSSDTSNQTGAATQRASSPQPQNKPTQPEQEQETKDGLGGFQGFPTFAGSNESPPTNTFSRHTTVAATVLQRAHAADAVAIAQQQHDGDPMEPVGSAGQPRAGGLQDVVTGQAKTVPLSPATAARGTANKLEDWSPEKKASLQFFLHGTGGSSGSSAAPSMPASSAPPMAKGPAGGPLEKGVYTELTLLLRSGPGGNVRRANGVLSNAGVPSSPSVRADVASNRYNPYKRPNIARPSLPVTTAPAASVLQPSFGAFAVPSAPKEAVQHQPHLEAKPPLPAAAVPVLPPNLRMAPPPSGVVPRPPAAPGAVRLAPGQMALPSGRSGTPLPKFFPLVGYQSSALATANIRPPAGSVGVKRQRESPAASPLLESGIRNLSEFKKRRPTRLEQHRPSLVQPARTPRRTTLADSGSEWTPGVVDSGGAGTAAETPGLSPDGAVAGGKVQTETARRMIGLLNSCERVGDAIAMMPKRTAGKSGARTEALNSTPMESPLPVTLMPPLERLDQSHYGGTPIPSINTMGAGFAYGATPPTLGNAGNAGQTPGPRMVLEFNTPSACPVPELPLRLDGVSGGLASPVVPGISTLPLSPITVPQAAVAADRDTGPGPTLKSKKATEFHFSGVNDVRSKADTVVAAASMLARRDDSTPEPTFGETAPKFRTPNFRTSIIQLRRMKEVCEAHAAAAATGSGSEAFTFGPAVADIGTTLPIGRADDIAASSGRAGALAAEEVAKAAAVPLPDDDEDVAGGTAASPAPVSTSVQVAHEQPQAQATKPILASSTTRISFLDHPEATPAKRPKDADGLVQEAGPAPTATPLATPGGMFCIWHAGTTPFQPPGADTTPVTTAVEKTSTAGNKDMSGAAQSSPFSFGTSNSAPSAAPVDVPMPASTLQLGQGSASSLFAFSGQQKHTATEGEKPSAAAQLDKADNEKAAISPGESGKSSFAALETRPSQPAIVPVSKVTPSTPEIAAPGLGFAFKGFGAPSAANESGIASTAAPGTAADVTQPSFRPALHPFSSSSTPTLSTAQASTSLPSSMPSFGVAPTCASGPAVSTGFTFHTAASSSGAAPSSAAPSTSFNFGAAQLSTSTAPSSFGSPMPVTNPSSAPSFGAVQPLAGSVGFNAGNFGAASNAGPRFTFGDSINGAVGSSSATMSSCAFGTQQGSSNPASTFTFGLAASTSAPTFGVASAAPVPSTTPAPQPSAGGGALTFGAAAPANPFGAAAPSFGTPAAQPAFGAPPAGTPSFGVSSTTQPPGTNSIFGASAPAEVTAQTASAAPTFGASTMPSFGGFGSNNGGAASSGMFTFGAPAASPFPPSSSPAPAFGQAAPSFGMQTQPASTPGVSGFGSSPAVGFGPPGGFGGQPAFGASTQPGADTGGGFSLGHGDPKDGRKRVKVRRHGH